MFDRGQCTPYTNQTENVASPGKTVNESMFSSQILFVFHQALA